MDRTNLVDALFQYYMGNPCLTEDIDYLDEAQRLHHYSTQIASMSNEEIKETLDCFEVEY